MPTDDAQSDGRHESVNEMADRQFTDLLQELRVAQTGVQILFAFLLSLPFSGKFATLGDGQRTTYLIALLSTTLATCCLLAPANQHRILFRQRRKPELVQLGTRLALAGMALVVLAIAAAATLVISVVLNPPAAVAIGAALAISFISLWYLLPLRLLRR
jgi:hypothetical protein